MVYYAFYPLDSRFILFLADSVGHASLNTGHAEKSDCHFAEENVTYRCINGLRSLHHGFVNVALFQEYFSDTGLGIILRSTELASSRDQKMEIQSGLFPR